MTKDQMSKSGRNGVFRFEIDCLGLRLGGLSQTAQLHTVCTVFGSIFRQGTSAIPPEGLQMIRFDIWASVIDFAFV